MTTPAAVDQALLERFQSLVGSRLGLMVPDSQRDHLVEVLHTRLNAHAATPADTYLAALAAQASDSAEWRAIAEPLTVGETYFFRNHEQLRAFAEVALPDRLRARGGERRLRVLSAGCASGEELYTLAILLQSHRLDEGWHVTLEGIDINAALLERARQARYSDWSLRATPAEMRRHFRPDGRAHVLAPELRAMARFELRNLLDADDAFWAPGSFDVIFFRNVSIYFSPEATQAVIARFARALAPGGYLFLGPAETLRGVSREFDVRHSHDAFYYQRRPAGEPAAPAVTAPPAPARAAPDLEQGWVAAIREAADRIETLAGSAAALSAPAAASAAWDLGQALALFREERFVEALALVRALPAEAQRNADVLLMQAAILTNLGRTDEAAPLCHQVLTTDACSAEAHYLLALSREHAGELEAAAHHAELAMHLAPDFAMPPLHRGLVARRAGHSQAARAALEQAHRLLALEDAARLLLFGGGFGREALQQLCRAELQRLGGSR